MLLLLVSLVALVHVNASSMLSGLTAVLDAWLQSWMTPARWRTPAKV